MKEDDRVRQIEAVNAQTGPVMIAYPAAPAHRRHAGARRNAGEPDVDVTADDGVRHQMWVIDDDAAIDAADTRLRRAAGDLYRGWPPPFGGGGARRQSTRRHAARCRRLAPLFPLGDLSAPRNDDPRLQPRGARSQRPQRRMRCSRRCTSVSRSRHRSNRCVRRRPASSACISPGRWYRLDAQARPCPNRRPDRPAADHAAGAQRARAAVRHRRPAHRQAHRLRRRRARPRRAASAGEVRRDGGRLRALSDADGRT